MSKETGLTGLVSFRVDKADRLIVTVQRRDRSPAFGYPSSDELITTWDDASVQDLTELGFIKIEPGVFGKPGA